MEIFDRLPEDLRREIMDTNQVTGERGQRLLIASITAVRREYADEWAQLDALSEKLRKRYVP